MNEESRGPDDELARDMATLRSERGPCPANQRLSDFRNGRLSADEEESIAAHVALCGLCDLRLSRMIPPDVKVSAAQWQRIEARLQERLAATPSIRTPVTWTERLRRFFRHPMLGYGLAVLLCIPAYKGLFPRPEAPSPAPQEIARSLPVHNLTHVRIIEFSAAKRGASPERPEVHIGSEDKILGLAFFVADRSRLGWRYDAEIVDDTGANVTGSARLQSQDGLGNFFLVVRAELLKGGGYELRVREAGSGTGQIVEHRLPFGIRR